MIGDLVALACAGDSCHH